MPKPTYNVKGLLKTLGWCPWNFWVCQKKGFQVSVSFLITLYLILEILKPNLDAIFYVVAQRGLINSTYATKTESLLSHLCIRSSLEPSCVGEMVQGPRCLLFGLIAGIVTIKGGEVKLSLKNFHC